MTARGASAVGQNVLLYKNSDNTYEYVSAVGGAGGTAVAVSNAPSISIAGKAGTDGSYRSTGGGGSGGGSGFGLYGKFNYGGASEYSHGGGGGGGWYGGGGGGVISFGVSSGGGGSSYISGYDGSLAILASSTSLNIIPAASSNHYSGLVFNSTSMIAGNAAMPSLSSATETGHSGNGVARFTYLGN